ncbi:hypothetical protein Z517_06974 [Fonsecaea pedrosoi CBS 271.37]|uniref:Unplaced genomic scaffold supercont1.4, whole genome shotgun sequence n=1 Tax=Fonsecaea pedrosoi CBS 271.37 TaxID=1442368 RepID=A0A0D2H6S2_9EURO|nr:uncharacterized protein Z517_06974 [Fonsecaea pedrosoi CBS 271.37]KIW80359.1 hypothetical protein Z517_06974 [Fonsecaea pedrosoi CBS 271.37]
MAVVPPPISNGTGLHPPRDEVLQHYEEFKASRINPLGSAQYIELEAAASQRFEALAEDPWVDHAAINAQTPTLKDGDDVKIIILGAGFGGLLYGARLVEAGFRPEDIRLIDTAGGFGGTWYWNRYPGLMCDVESYVYAPLLEETNYMPKHRYSYGTELKEQADRIAQKYGLTGFFRAYVESATWDDQRKRWAIKVEENRGPGQDKVHLTVYAQFVISATGFLNHPKVPNVPGLENFEGEMFHTARWNYRVTGGSPEDPSLTRLKGKRVGIIGTGATSIQATPELAKWAKELYVFQRTPSSVDVRGQRETNVDEWTSKIATHKGWQHDRCDNFLQWSVGLNPGEEDLVNDGWTHALSYIGFMGAPHDKPIQPEEVPNHIARLLAIDEDIAEQKRQRIAKLVKDPETAKALTPWYPTWCKRPCFHDDYLPTFNLPHVHLVSTLPRGIERGTSKGLVVNGKEYELDVLIFSTGYRPPGAGQAEPGSMGNMQFVGRDSLTMSKKWQTKGASTLHSFLTHDFPNLFLGGYVQIGNGQHATYIMDLKAQHLAYMLAEAHKGVKDSQRLTMEATEDAEEAWSQDVAKHAAWFAAYSICTPGFATNEGEDLKPLSLEETLRKARAAPHAQGLINFRDVLRRWREAGNMAGVDISTP